MRSLWVLSITLLGYFLGRSFPSLGENIDKAILVILAFSVIPVAYEWRKHRRKRHQTPVAEGTPRRPPKPRRDPQGDPDPLARARGVQLGLGEHRAHLEADVGERVLPLGAAVDRADDVSTTAPASRSARVASRTAPPVVITSSTRVTRRPATSGPSASLQVPYSLACLRTNSAGQPGAGAEHGRDRDAAELEPAEQLGAVGDQLDHLLHDARQQRGIGLEEVLVEVLRGHLTRTGG